MIAVLRMLSVLFVFFSNGEHSARHPVEVSVLFRDSGDHPAQRSGWLQDRLAADRTWRSARFKALVLQSCGCLHGALGGVEDCIHER